MRALSTMNRVTEALSFTGLRIRHAADRRESAARRRSVPGLDRFRRFLARLAQVHVQIDESGATIIPQRRKFRRPCSPANFPGAPTSFTNSPSSRTSSAASVFDAGSITRPFLISSMLRVLAFETGSAQRDPLRGDCASRVAGACAAGCAPSSAIPAISRYSSAMRTATPLVTCSSTQDCGPSATSGVISMPRFIGPGCRTSASGLARFSRSAFSW